MTTEKHRLSGLDTYVFVDVSNIRNACRRSCGIQLDFVKLIAYLKQKYKKLLSVKYFEGIASGDSEKEAQFEEYQRAGYEICALARKAYYNRARYKDFSCVSCGAPNHLKVLEKTTQLKSNVDVYVATEILKVALLAKRPVHIILFACDGDYAEMIKTATVNKNVRVTVIATPYTGNRRYNCLSSRLKDLAREVPARQYRLRDISEIRDRVS